MRTDYRPRTKVARELGFWITLTLGAATWFGAILWMMLHTLTGPRL